METIDVWQKLLVQVSIGALDLSKVLHARLRDWDREKRGISEYHDQWHVRYDGDDGSGDVLYSCTFP